MNQSARTDRSGLELFADLFANPLYIAIHAVTR